jgi:hypothetical protein
MTQEAFFNNTLVAQRRGRRWPFVPLIVDPDNWTVG